MPAIDFPNSPTVGQQFTSGNRTWEWTGTVWATVAFPLGATSPVTYTDGEFGFDSLAYAQQENFELLYVKNTTGSAITKGSAVYVSGSTGDNVLITKAQANSELTSTKTVGLVYADIANDGFGYVVTSGKITGIDTSTAAAGDPVWLSPTTAGGITFGVANKPVAPNHMVYLGIVVRAHATTGEIEVAVQNGYELDELHNVLIESPADNEVIAWDNATSIWKNQTAAEAGLAAASHTHAIADTTGLQTALDAKMPAMTAGLGNGDFNTYINPGMYRFDVPSANGPGHSYGSLLVVRGASSDTIGQTTWDYATGAMYTRSAQGIGGTPNWTAWKRIGMVTQSTADPSGGYDGDIWMKYTP